MATPSPSGYFREVNALLTRDEYRHEADQQGAEYQREYPELRGGRGGGYPLAPSEEVGRRDAVAPQYLDAGHSVGDVLVGDEGDDTRR